MQFLKKATKRIIYTLTKKNFQELRSLRNGDGTTRNTLESTLKILRGLIKKGLVARSEFGDGYYLTEEGKKIAKPIIDEIDEYKRW